MHTRRRRNETNEQLIRRFNIMVARSGILEEVEARRWYTKPSERRNEQRKELAKKMRQEAKKQRRQQESE